MPRYAIVQIDAVDQPLQDAATLPPMPGGYSVLHVGQLVDGNVRHVAALLNLLLGFPVGHPHRVRYVLRAYVKKATTVAHQRTGYLVVPTVAAPAVLARTRTFWITPSGTAAVSREWLDLDTTWPIDVLVVPEVHPKNPVTIESDTCNVKEVVDLQRLLPTAVMDEQAPDAQGSPHVSSFQYTSVHFIQGQGPFPIGAWTHNPYKWAL
jgi:hypothetical protein